MIAVELEVAVALASLERDWGEQVALERRERLGGSRDAQLLFCSIESWFVFSPYSLTVTLGQTRSFWLHDNIGIDQGIRPSSSPDMSRRSLVTWRGKRSLSMIGILSTEASP